MRSLRVSIILILLSAVPACVRPWPGDPGTSQSKLPVATAATPDAGEPAAATPTPSVLLPLLPLEASPGQEGRRQIVFEDGQNLWLVDLSGEKAVNLTEGRRFIGPPGLEEAVSPDGSYLAFLSMTDDRFHGLTLHVVELPSTEKLLTLPLTSEGTEPGPEPAQGDPRVEIVRVLMEPGNLAWSPDGQSLAYIGAYEGPSADLYTFDVETGANMRLSDGPSQALAPSWSPDGQYILHAGVSGLGTGAGYGTEGVWVAAADGSAIRSLYDPGQSGGEIWVGWFDQDTFIVYSFGAVCGLGNLRTYNIVQGAERILWAGTFQHVAFNRISGHLLLSVEEMDPTCNPTGLTGLVLTHPEAQDGVQVWEDSVFELVWSAEANAFLATDGNQSLLITDSGDVMPLTGPPAGVPQFSTTGRKYAWIGPAFQAPEGVWVNEGGKIEQIFDGFTTAAVWESGSEVLYFFASDGLYRWQTGSAAERFLPDRTANSAVIVAQD